MLLVKTRGWSDSAGRYGFQKRFIYSCFRAESMSITFQKQNSPSTHKKKKKFNPWVKNIKLQMKPLEQWIYP